ncbi:MAG: 3-oxoacyl-ACP reductase FabG [Dehalococcoidia bacterium]|nr:MAG: 3-oxoacyl-ACP reductase FabG [Dehalococcoidia bacterium]
MAQQKELDGKVAIVTGGASGIGQAIVHALVKEGAKVAIADVNMELAQQVVAGAKELGGECIAVKTDVSNSKDVYSMVDETLRQFGTIDILVNDAGLRSAPSVRQVSEEEWDRVIAVNLKGTFLCSKAVVDHMVEKKWGRIVNFASGQWLRPVGAAAYAASKGGVISMSKSLAAEVAGEGVNVNVVCPGFTDTPMTRGVFPSDEVFESVIANPSLLGSGIAPLRGQIASAEDIANFVMLLFKPAFDHVTGQTLHVNGGSLMW